jgi:hypothetical protein
MIAMAGVYLVVGEANAAAPVKEIPEICGFTGLPDPFNLSPPAGLHNLINI